MASRTTDIAGFHPSEEGHWNTILGLAAGRGIVHTGDIEALGAFGRLYGPVAVGDRRAGFVIGQLGQSLDGRVATATGSSHFINCPEGIRHLHRLRALVDAVIVGVGTAVADDPRLTVRDVPGNHPARVVIDPNGRLPPDARLLVDDGVEVLVIQARYRPVPSRASSIVIPARNGCIPPEAIVAALAERGYRRLLVEGGAWTVSAFLAAGMLDRLHVCVAPLVIGSGPIGITLPPIDDLGEAMRPAASIHRLGDDILFDCTLERRALDPRDGSLFDLVES
jgi:riboflavin-specific deaminase-like protein